MIVVQHPERIQSFHLRSDTLLPVNPPEINAFLFSRVMQISKICLHELLIRHIKLDWQLLFTIDPQSLCHRFIHLLIGPHTVRRMNVQRHMHSLFMKPSQKSLRIRKKLLIPCITSPAGSVFLINIHQMPVHINDRHRQRHILRLETFHQLSIRLFRIFMIAAPPVPQRIPWHHRRSPTQSVEILNTGQIIRSIPPEVQINYRMFPGFHPAIFPDHKRLAVIHHRMPQLRHKPLLQRNLTVRIVQCPGRSFQITDIDHLRLISVTPRAAKRKKTTFHIDRETIGTKLPFVIAQMDPFCDNLQISHLVDHLEFACPQISVPHDLRRPVFKHSMFRILQPDKSRRQYADPVLFPRDNILRPAYGNCFDLIILFHMLSSFPGTLPALNN